MNYLNLKRSLSVLAAAALLFNSCKRISTPEPIGDAGQTIVKLSEAEKKLINLDLVSTPQIVRMVEIYRNVASSRDLNRTMTVLVKDDPGIVADYNNANGTNFVPIPSNLYTVDPATPKVGNNYTVVLQPTEFAKTINFLLPSALALDLNLSYAFGFSLVSVDADGRIGAVDRKIVVEVGVKNQWDGIYNLRGYVTRETAPAVLDPALSGVFGPLEVALATTGGRVVTFNAHPWANGSGSQFAVAVVPTYTIGSGNTVETSSPGGAYPAGITNAPGYSCRYEPGSKTFFVKYIWASAGLPRVCTDTLTYLRAR